MSAPARDRWVASVLLLMGGIAFPSVASAIQAKADAPTSARDAVALLDLRTLPKLNPDRESFARPTYVSYESKSSIAGALAFFQAELGAVGWKETRGYGEKNYDTKDYADHVYLKDGQRVRLTLGNSGEGKTSVGLTSLGNVDASTLPKPPKSKPLAEPSALGAQYLCEDDVATVAASCKKAMAESGWHAFESFHPLPNDNPKVAMVEFLKNGAHVTLIVSSHAQVHNGKTTGGYLVAQVLPFDVPIVDDATEVQIETESPRMECRSAWEPARVAEFYRSAYGKLGWKETRRDGKRQDGGEMISFDNDKDFRFAIIAIPHNEAGIRVIVEPVSRKEPKLAQEDEKPEPAMGDEERMKAPDAANVAGLDAAITAEIKAVAAKIAADSGVDISKALDAMFLDKDKPEAKPPVATLAAEAVPLPKSAMNVTRDSVRKTISYISNEDMATQETFFKEQLKLLGWSAVSASRSSFNKHVDLTLEFSKDSQSIETHIIFDGDSGKGTTTIEGDGLRFSATGTTPPTPTASKDAIESEDDHGLPIPKEKTGKSSEGTLYRRMIEVQTPVPLDALVTFYRGELAAKGWVETASAAKVSKEAAEMSYAKKDMTLSVRVTGGESSKIVMVERNAAKAQNTGLLPREGRARIAIGNQFGQDAVVQINGQPYNVAKGIGVKDASTGLKLDLFPGKNKLVIKLPGKKDQTEVVAAAAGETWGLIILEDGAILSMQVY